MECTGERRSTVRTAALVAAVAAVAAAGAITGASVVEPAAPEPAPASTAGAGGRATLLVALPDRITASSNRAW